MEKLTISPEAREAASKWGHYPCPGLQQEFAEFVQLAINSTTEKLTTRIKELEQELYTLDRLRGDL
jgi:hypothetical protein